jgi:drug/metabolite transporter (DMT)-like permease
MVLSHFFLNDKCSVLRTISTFGLVCGVVLIFQPQTFIFADLVRTEE